MQPVISKAVLATLLCLPLICAAKYHRSHAAKAAFQHMVACPATGRHRGKCPGYVIDHVKPLCAGGADDPSNMQWQPLAESKSKDKLEWKECRRLRLAK